MAKEKFCFLTMTAPVKFYEKIITDIILQNGVHMEKASSVLDKSSKKLYPMGNFNEYATPLKQCVQIASENNIDLKYSDFSNDFFDLDGAKSFIDNYKKETDQIKNRINEIEKEISENSVIIEKVRYLEDIDLELNEFWNFEYIKFRFGRISKVGYSKLRKFLAEENNIFFFATSSDVDFIYGMYFVTSAASTRIDSFIDSLHFERIMLPDSAAGKPKEIFDNLTERNAALEEEKKELIAKSDKFAADNKERILKCYSYLKYYYTVYDIRKYCMIANDMFYVSGWIPEKKLKDCIVKIEQINETDKDIQIMYYVDEPENLSGLTPPTQLKNIPVINWFEQFVTMYGVPAYNEIDPTPFLAISYALLFGAMFGDVGQGLCLSLLGIAAWFIKKMPLGKVIAVIGVVSALFGCFYGSVFGYENIIPGYHVMENSKTIGTTLVVSVACGALIITVSMIINIINGIRQKKVEKYLFSPNGVAGMLLYWGIIAGIVGIYVVDKNIFTPVYVLLIIVVPVLLIFFKEPLSVLLAKGKARIENKGMYVVENIFELFDVCLSYVTNTISFLRVGAFALNHAGMMLAVFILSGAASGSANPYIFVAGNALVIGLEGLIVGIQVLRLEFYEIFSRFYSGDGKKYAPLEINY